MADYIAPGTRCLVFDYETSYTPPSLPATLNFVGPPQLWLQPPGLNSLVFGTALAATRQAVFCTGIASAFATGAALVWNKNQLVTTNSIAQEAYGTTRAWLGQQWAIPAGIVSAEAFGTIPEVAISFYRMPYGNGVTFRFFGSTYTPPSTTSVPLEMTLGTALFKMIATSSLGNLLAFGSTSIRNDHEIVAPPGLLSLAWGAPTVTKTLAAEDATLGLLTAFGTAGVELYTRYLLPSGFTQLKFGFPLDGVGSIAHLNRTLQASGFTQTAFGATLASGGLRYVDQSGRGIGGPSFGTQFIAYKERRLYPLGVVPGTVPTGLMVGTNQFITGAGWDSLAWGVNEITDDRQFARPAGIAATAYGAADVNPNPRVVAPLGIHDDAVFPHGQWGLNTVYNLTQYIHQLFDDRDTDYLEGFGSPVHASIENVNRSIGAVGSRMDHVSILARVSTTAREVTPVSWESAVFGFGLGLHPDGRGFIAYRNRSLTAPGPYDAIEGYVSPLHAVSRTPEIDTPSIPVTSAFGLPALLNTRRSFPVPSMGDTLEWGAPRVEYVVRELLPNGLDAYGFAIPDVENNTRYLAPASIELPTFAFGRQSVEEHFNIIATHGQLWSAMGLEHYVRNVTPELHPCWTDDTSFGSNGIHNAHETYEVPGFEQLFFGRAAIGERTQRPQPHGFNTETVGPFTDVHNNTPDPPESRLIIAQPASDIRGDGSDAPPGVRFTHIGDVFGAPTVTWNSIFPAGQVMSLFGSPTVRANSLYPSSFWEDLQPGGQFGTPSLNATQYVDLRDKGLHGAFDDDADRPAARIDPFTIYCSFDVPLRYNDGLPTPGRWEYIDYVTGDDGRRPFFGSPRVSNQYREVVALHTETAELDLTTGERFGGLTHIDLGDRLVRANGIKGYRAGFPVITHGGEANLDYFHNGIEAGDFGDVTVTPSLGAARIGVPGIDALRWGANRCELLNRDVTTTGWDSQAFGTLPWPFVGPPNWRYMQGFIATDWGTQFVSYRIRDVVTQGALDESFTPNIDEFAQRMRVTRQNRLTPESIVQAAFGLPTVWRYSRSVSGVGLMDTSIIARPDVRRLNIVALGGYGWLDEDFGDVWRVEDGTIKCRGWSAGSLGNNGKFARTLPANGWLDEAFGAASLGDVLYATGFDGAAFGDAVATHTDGLEFTCGLLPRAVVADAINASGIGEHALQGGFVHPVGWLGEEFGHPQVHGEDDIVTTGWLDEVYGTAQLNRTLPANGWLDESFGTARSTMNVGPSGWLDLAFGATRPAFGIGPSGFSTESWWANYVDTNDYAASDYFANDNAHKVSHV